MESKHVMNFSGRDYVLYAGVLAEAHSQGLLEVRVELLQIPHEGNKNTAIVKALVRMAPRQEGGPERVFEELGDADPTNCNKTVQRALIRMAATRAKGRALRDAINCAEVLAEELSDRMDESDTPPARQVVYRGASGTGSAGGQGAANPDFCATCGVELTKGQREVSLAKFQKPLCPAHQPKAGEAS